MGLSRAQLQGLGYEGFVSFDGLRGGGLAAVPRAPGTYVVLVEGIVPQFAERSRGGHFKGNDPSVAIDILPAKWVEGAPVAYVGKGEDLQRRLREFCRFGAGAAVGHWGGRYLWQVDGSDEWLVGWKSCDAGQTALVAEAAMLDEFSRAHGARLPFANLRR